MDKKLVLIIVSLLLPPLAVGLKKGVGKDFAINVLLCVLMWVPGVIHALWVVTR
ncbi:MAG: YqaE/Pmp3 family membrane protein [Pseudomonadales bacterium]|nr:YqaE/Pmp3 family membrane protein [Pseudomonadales bacterium]